MRRISEEEKETIESKEKIRHYLRVASVTLIACISLLMIIFFTWFNMNNYDEDITHLKEYPYWEITTIGVLISIILMIESFFVLFLALERPSHWTDLKMEAIWMTFLTFFASYLISKAIKYTITNPHDFFEIMRWVVIILAICGALICFFHLNAKVAEVIKR